LLKIKGVIKIPDARRGSRLGGLSLPLPYLWTCKYWWIFGGVGYKTSNKRETYVRVLDYLPYGHPDDPRPVYQKKPLVQAIGEDKFVFLELAPKKNKIPKVCDRVYIGSGEREVIDHVIKRLKYRDLTQIAKKNLPYVLERIVKDNEKWFIQFFNRAHPNCFMMLPSVGDIKTRSIKEEREKREFSNFEDLTRRVDRLYYPEKIIAKIIETEVTDEATEGLFIQDQVKMYKKFVVQEARKAYKEEKEICATLCEKKEVYKKMKKKRTQIDYIIEKKKIELEMKRNQLKKAKERLNDNNYMYPFIARTLKF